MRASPTPVAARALDHPGFRRYWTGLWCSTLAFWMLRVAVGWSAWETSRSAFGTGLVAALTMAPPALLAPLFGVVADRVRLAVAVPVVALSFAALAALLGALSLADRLAFPTLAAIAALHGLVAAAWQPLRLTIPARLVPRELLPETVSLSSMTFQVARVVGPAVAGIGIARLGVASVYAAVALAYLGFLALFLTVRLAPRETDARDADPFLARFGAGLRVALAMCEVRPTLAATLVGGIVARGALELLPAVAGGRLDGGATALAWLTSAAGLGAVAGGLVAARAPSDARSLARRFALTGAAGSVATLALGLVGGLPATALACAAIGLFATLTGVSCQSLLQLTVADAYRGRVLSLWTTAGFGGAVLGTLVLGALGDRVGLADALVGLGGTGALAFAAIAALDRGRAPSGRSAEDATGRPP